MRFVWAVVAFVLATVLIGAGIAQRTVFMGPTEQRMELSVGEPEPYVLVDAEVLRAHPGLQTLLVRGEGEIFVAYGRTSDMTAWLSDTAYNSITLNGEGSPKAEHVDAALSPADGAESPGRDPRGSDLWLDSFSEEDSLVAPLQLTEGNSVLISRDGVEPAPADVLVSWRLDTRTPLAGPLITAGAVMLAAGLVLYVLAIRYQRRGRGPRRKGPGPLPPTEPIGVTAAPERQAIDAGADAGDGPDEPPRTEDNKAAEGSHAGRADRRALTRRVGLAVPALAVTAILATGCTAESWPQLGAESPTPTPTPSVVAPENQKPPAIGEKQADRVIADIVATIEKADAERDIELAETRVTGPALEARRTDYALRGKLADREPQVTAPRDEVSILLPEATDSWPRTVLVLTVAEGDETVPPVMLSMTQADPWSNYRVSDIAEMPASGQFPDVAPAWLGTTRVPAESPFLSLAPEALADAFSDFVDAGDKSEFAGSFDEVAQKLAADVRASRETVVKGLADKNASKTSKASFDMKPASGEPMSMATLDSGAIVSVSVVDTETVTPTTKDAVIRFGDNAEAKALTGATEAAKGVVTTYGMQLYFSVPAQGSNEQIRLLAYKQNLLSVKVIK
ncbi:glycosyl transferase [Microbacterium sp.]|uniref:glycosyl transferase n=1 Tax=Microbacterium sp. TaxID=51671 RepID=UPI002810EA42|nr:glycosyl transferase [Microbacterium sp.]